MKYLLLSLAIFASTAHAAPEQICKELQQDADEIFQELSYADGIICVYSTATSNEHVTIRFFALESNIYKAIATNYTLIQLQDMQSSPPDISITSKARFQITHAFPRDTYVIELEKQGPSIQINKTYKSIILNSEITNQEPNIITLSAKRAQIKNMKFESLTQKQAFDSQSLELLPSSKGAQAIITSERALLFNNPDTESKTNSYLIRNDAVKLLEFKDNWLLVGYKPRKGAAIRKWIKITDIL